MDPKPPLERRSWPGELRAVERDAALRVSGLAVPFDVEADLGRFGEVIKPGAMRRLAEGRDTKLLVGHDVGKPLASRRAGTLTLEVAGEGLRFDAVLPDSPTGREAHASVKRGDLSACSIGFRVRADRWEQRAGHAVRIVDDLDLFEVSLVAVPAFEATFVEARALAHAEQLQQHAFFLRRRQAADVLLAEVRRQQQAIFREAALAEALTSRELPRRGDKPILR